MKKKEAKTLPLYMPGLMQPIQVPIENLSEDVKKQMSLGKGPVSAKISNNKYVIKVGNNGMYMEPDVNKEKEEKEKMKSELMKEVENEISQKYNLAKKKKTKKTAEYRFKEKDQKKEGETIKEKSEDKDEEEENDDTSQLKKMVLELTNQVKSLKIQNEHMMDDDFKKKGKNKQRAKTINKIGALKLLLTNLRGELKDDDTDSDLSSIKGQLDRLEAK